MTVGAGRVVVVKVVMRVVTVAVWVTVMCDVTIAETVCVAGLLAKHEQALETKALSRPLMRFRSSRSLLIGGDMTPSPGFKRVPSADFEPLSCNGSPIAMRRGFSLSARLRFAM